MVNVTSVLARVPVIKFRKGGLGRPAGAAPSAGSALGSCPASAAPSSSGPATAQAAAPMSTSTLSDVDLPARYQRTPLSEEEIAHINGGGIA